MEDSIFDEVLMEGLSDKVTFEQRLKVRSEPCQKLLDKEFPQQKSRWCKVFEARGILEH